MTRCIWLSRPGNGSNRKSRPLGRLFFVFCTSTRQRGESRRIYHLPHGGGRQPPGRPGAALGSWVATKGGKSGRWYIFPMEAAGSRQASPELSWRAGWPPWKRRADGCTIFHMEAAARPARSCPGELVATRRGESRRMCHLPHGGGRKPYKERSQVIPDSFPLPLDPIKGNGIRFLLLVCVWPGLARITTTPFIF